MVIRTVLLLVPALLLACGTTLPVMADEKGDPGKDELKKFQGTWTFISMEQDGEQQPKGEEIQTITFERDKFTVKLGNKVIQAGKQKLDPTKKPKAVDATVTEGEGKGTTMLGIYVMDRDTIKACFDPMGKKRPTEFKTTAGSGYFLVVIKQADKKEGRPVPVEELEVERKVDLKDLQQRTLRWVLVFDTKNGEDYAKQLAAFDAILAVPAGDTEYQVIRDLSKRPVKGKVEDLDQIKRIYWVDDKPESVKPLAKALGLTTTPDHIVSFFPEKLEKELLEKELKFAGRKENDIYETRFKVVKKGEKYEVEVVEQKPKKGSK